MTRNNGTKVEALLFDVFGTVVDWRGGIIREAEPFLRAHGSPVGGPEFADRWRGLYQPSMEKVRTGAREFTKLDVLHRENLDHLVKELGLDPDGPELESLNLAWHRLDPWADSVEGLKRLRKRFLVAPLSNGNVRLLTDMAKRAGLPWDCILGAEVVRAYKPDPQAYRDTAGLLNLQPAQCMMVAAHNDDLAAAADAGLRTAFVLRPTEHGPEQSTDLGPDASWDYVASDLVELADLLRN
ncbi:haloacid dehalogenase type II [Tianweitania sediminis]|uniref:(S)-2-haloacid dehalogenase n=1 Tax=Tianweitania sediminis TaxID=1502156 RepID=A0A8J7R565_9HYPH|nr:haloacid dehalogenase type II [Tianweitania sediminis]MBP0441463.1 haloacid dehalogenase type II [Tianweitania sediminis]